MGIATSNISYINGTNVHVTESTNFVGDDQTHVGRKELGGTPPAYLALSGAVLVGVDYTHPKIAYQTDPRPDAYAQRIGSPPSGYGTNGAPTYGDGQFSKVTTWGNDTSNDANQKLYYSLGQSGVAVGYNELT